MTKEEENKSEKEENRYQEVNFAETGETKGWPAV